MVLTTALLLTGSAAAFEAGFRQISVAGPTPKAPATTVALYYPTQTPARAIPMGPFTPNVAFEAAPASMVKGLIVLSHGTGGTELGYSSLAEALAQNGYLVAALRHPGDNWQDRSLLLDNPDKYFIERPRQVSSVLDALLRDPQWKDRISRDARGPKVGAVGHSAGGYTVLALAGGQPDLSRIAKHCEVDRVHDPIFCRTGRSDRPLAPVASALPLTAQLTDDRVRAVVALAPVGVVFTAQSLAKIRLPVAVYEAEGDRWVVPRFHTAWIALNIAQAELHRVPNAWHFAFMDAPSRPIPTDDGDVGADPPGFERSVFLKRLSLELPAFFDKALQ
ncbi:MAG: alpha/beta fold hydrolase [Burkholderiaceae bacterium]